MRVRLFHVIDEYHSQRCGADNPRRGEAMSDEETEETAEESRDDRYADVDTSHLDDVEDGCGCTEIWEHTSEREDAVAEDD